MKLSTYFHMKTKILADFQICNSAPLIKTEIESIQQLSLENSNSTYSLENEELNFQDTLIKQLLDTIKEGNESYERGSTKPISIFAFESEK